MDGSVCPAVLWLGGDPVSTDGETSPDPKDQDDRPTSMVHPSTEPLAPSPQFVFQIRSLLQVLRQPPEHRVVPELAVQRLEDPVPFIGEVKEF